MSSQFVHFFQSHGPLGWFGLDFFLLFIVLSVAWYFCEKIKNATFVDVIWGISFGSLACLAAVLGSAPVPRKLILLIAILPWSIRLFIYLLYRTLKKFPHEDERYTQLRKAWGNRESFMMFGVFQFQGLLISILSLPFAAVTMDSSPHLYINEILGAVVCFVGFAGESIADQQKMDFVSNKDNKGKTCNFGLWKYSRHPNYFFEWLVWIGIFLMSLHTANGVVFIYCPLLMLYMLTQLSGVKLAEQHSLKSRGDEYKLYQQTTSSFVPWFKLANNGK